MQTGRKHTSPVSPPPFWPIPPASGHEESSAARLRGSGGIAVDGLIALPQEWPQDKHCDEEHRQVRIGDE